MLASPEVKLAYFFPWPFSFLNAIYQQIFNFHPSPHHRKSLTFLLFPSNSFVPPEPVRDPSPCGGIAPAEGSRGGPPGQGGALPVLGAEPGRRGGGAHLVADQGEEHLKLGQIRGTERATNAKFLIAKQRFHFCSFVVGERDQERRRRRVFAAQPGLCVVGGRGRVHVRGRGGRRRGGHRAGQAEHPPGRVG